VLDSECDGCDQCKDHWCVPNPPACIAHSDCETGFFCDTLEDGDDCNNTCEPGCVDDSDCHGSGCDYCEDHVCVANPPACVTHNDCGDGFYCNNLEDGNDCTNSCELGCVVDSDCHGSGCDYCEDHVCIANPPACVTHDDCGDGFYCDNLEDGNDCTNTCEEGCLDNSDCDGCDECKDHSCVTVEPECTSHLECNEGLTGVCDGLMTQCMYCDVDDNNTCNNKCTPGCVNDFGSTRPMCPSNAPYCNEEHHCSTTPGHTLLTTIVITTTDCQNCEGGSAVFTIIGDDDQTPQPNCRTGTDFDWETGLQAAYQGREVVEVSDPTCNDPDNTEDLDAGWGTCACSPLDGEITELSFEWKGPGTWTPYTVCFDWHKVSQHVTVCTWEDGEFNCDELEGEVECP